jgi:hypothetical protein
MVVLMKERTRRENLRSHTVYDDPKDMGDLLFRYVE